MALLDVLTDHDGTADHSAIASVSRIGKLEDCSGPVYIPMSTTNAGGDNHHDNHDRRPGKQPNSTNSTHS